MKLGIENIRKLLDALGNPQKNYLKIQVAGTNGKGSVCAFLDAILHEAGVTRGVLTSPHLVSITERIRINGVDIAEDDFARHATRVRTVAEELLRGGELEYLPTFFEQVTAIVLIAFAGANVEVAVLETGLGGRLDATTAANAEIAAITRIDLDHQEYLGETIEEIAAEKAAIIRPCSKVVLGEQSSEVMNILLARCAEVGVVPVVAASEDRNPTVRETASSELGLKGSHQIKNANIAVALAEILNEYFPISAENISDGLINARHPGRLEFQGQYLFDGAHNASGAKALRTYLDEAVKQPITLIFASMQGKEVNEIAQMLFPRCDNIVLARPSNSRAMSPDEIAEHIPSTIDPTKIVQTSDVCQAIDRASELTAANGIILVTGSLYLVGEVKKILNN